MRIKKRDKIAIAIFIIFYICFGLLISLNQERVVYRPSQQDFDTCAQFNAAKKVTHNGTRMYVTPGYRGIVVLYHGNGGSACDRAFFAEEILAAGYGYIVPEYAGYSNDTRRPTHDLIKKDVQNVIDYLAQQDIREHIVIGESIGTGVAAYHVSLVEPERLLLIAPFASLADLAQRRFWYYPTRHLVNNAFDNIELLREYQRPITIVHGEKDMIVSQSSSKKLYSALQSLEKKYISVPNVGHNNLFYAQEAYPALREFLAVNE